MGRKIVTVGTGRRRRAGGRLPARAAGRGRHHGHASIPPRSAPTPKPIWPARRQRVKDIRPGLQKEIVWADPATKAKTPLAIVYIHGFSASKGEVRPLPDKVAAALGANLFYTRLTGHGQDGARDGGGQRQCLDQRLCRGDRDRPGDRRQGGGDRHLDRRVAGDLGASQPGLSKDVATIIAISPNYGLQAAGSDLLTLPWGGAARRTDDRQGAQLRAAVNALNAQLWTTRYPTSAILPLAALTRLAYATPVETIAHPGAVHLFATTTGGAAGADARDRRPLGRAARAGAGRAQRRSVQPRDSRRRAVAGDDASAGGPDRGVGEGGGGVT